MSINAVHYFHTGIILQDLNTSKSGEGLVVQTGVGPRAGDEAKADPEGRAGVQRGAGLRAGDGARVRVLTGVEPRAGDGARADLEARLQSGVKLKAGTGARAGVQIEVGLRVGGGARAVIAVDPSPDLDPGRGAEVGAVGGATIAVRAAAAVLPAAPAPECAAKTSPLKNWRLPDVGRSWRSF